MNGTRLCPIWGTPTRPDELYSGDGHYIDSLRAGGKYFIDGRATVMMDNLSDRKKARLTTWIIEQHRSGVRRPEIWSFENEIESITRRAVMTVNTRADELLKYIQKKTSYLGFEYELQIQSDSENTMEMLAYTESVNENELAYLRNYLIERSWLVFNHGRSKVIITVEGYAHLAEMEKAVTDSSQAFVAMWFDDSVEEAWTRGIKPAIENAGYHPVRIDNQEYIGKIDDEIIAEIRRSRFIVADFTQGTDGARGGVYYEAGFAHGLDIPVVFTCSQVSINDVHFDTSHYNHIVWRNPEDLKERLENRIAAVIGDGPINNRNNDV